MQIIKCKEHGGVDAVVDDTGALPVRVVVPDVASQALGLVDKLQELEQEGGHNTDAYYEALRLYLCRLHRRARQT